MLNLSIDVTTRCNLKCSHCLRDPNVREDLDIETLERLLREFKNLGGNYVCFTGGEPGMYPHLERAISLLAELGMVVGIVTNGVKFDEHFVPILDKPKLKRAIVGLTFSLDGGSPATHDIIRGEGNFIRTIEAITKSRLYGVPTSVKSILHNRRDKDDIIRMIHLLTSIGAQSAGLLIVTETSRYIDEDLGLSDDENREWIDYIAGTIIPNYKLPVHIEGISATDSPINLCNPVNSIHLNVFGQMVFCCNLATAYHSKPVPGCHIVGDFTKSTLAELLPVHFHKYADFLEARLKHTNRDDFAYKTCTWCHAHFGIDLGLE